MFCNDDGLTYLVSIFRCNHEYLDLYTEVPSRDVDLIATPFGGRYCGRIPPRLRISLYNILVISFYSDQKSVEGVFQGTYEFVDGGKNLM